MKIYAPNNNANGVYASVMFVNGVGETNNPHLIEWFVEHGYDTDAEKTSGLEFQEPVSVTKVPSPPIEEVEMMGYTEKETQKEKSFEDMTPLELREWAIENGLGSKIRNTRNKDKLLEIIRG